MARRKPGSASWRSRCRTLDVTVTQTRGGVGVAAMRLSRPASEWGLNPAGDGPGSVPGASLRGWPGGPPLAGGLLGRV